MIAELDKSELILLSFTEEQHALLKWKHSKEFEWQGGMYDIVDSTHEGNVIHYWCWWDYEETELNKTLRNSLVQVLGTNPKSQQYQFEITQFYKSLFFESAEKFSSTISRDETKHFVMCDKNLNTQNFPPDTPPPELI